MVLRMSYPGMVVCNCSSCHEQCSAVSTPPCIRVLSARTRGGVAAQDTPYGDIHAVGDVMAGAGSIISMSRYPRWSPRYHRVYHPG